MLQNVCKLEKYKVVQPGPKLQSSAQVLAQSEHYIQGGIHPSTTNFLKDFKHTGRLRFCSQSLMYVK